MKQDARPLSLEFLARYRIAILSLALVLVTAAVYWPVTRHDFINVDDPRFVTENPQVQAGLTYSGIVWAFHSVYTESWQPVTWISHMLDCQLYGLNAGYHHLTSLLFHLANTVLLFLWLYYLTQAVWRSAMVAALFALHPLHVESVAWICERKDMLSAFFWLLALLAYTRYAKKPGLIWYALALVFFACGLMSKPMVVTLPCVFLLLDLFALNRLQVNSFSFSGMINGGALRKALWLFCEKIPFFLLVAGSMLVTLYAQKQGGSLGSMANFPLSARVMNALIAYFKYITTSFWPVNLAYVYPYSFNLSVATAISAALLLVMWTICCAAYVRRQSLILVGWLWFVGTLFPTIGVVQFCLQARADRYTYIPGVGLFIVVVWGAAELFNRWPNRRGLAPSLAGVALVGCIITSSIQLSYWQNSVTVARHAVEVTDDNYVAYESLGRSISAMGQPQRAISFFSEASRLAPAWPQGQFNYGLTLALVGDTNAALDHLQTAVNLVPDYPEGRACFGRVLLKFGRNNEAVQQFAEAARLDPLNANVQEQWGTALAQVNQTNEAVTHLSEALRLQPNLIIAQKKLDQIRSGQLILNEN